MSTAQVLALALPAAVALLLVTSVATWRAYGWLEARKARHAR